jgi:SNF2 family DNA or RNA helicase
MKPILHALWLPADTHNPHNALAVWAESEGMRRSKATFDHPQAMSAAAIVHNLWQVSPGVPLGRLTETARQLALLLPSDDRRPLRSVADHNTPALTGRRSRRRIKAHTLRPWRVEALLLPPPMALTFLLSLSETSQWMQLGPSVSFWKRAAQLAAMVLMRGQYLPAADDAGSGRWRVMLAEAGLAEAVVALAQAMPPSARALARPLPDPLALVHDYLGATVHEYVGQNYTPGQSPFYDPRKWQPKPTPPTPQDFWWLDLWPRSRHNLSTLRRDPSQAELGEAVRAWSLNAYAYVSSDYRVAFRLEPPQSSEAAESAEWRLTFHLQSRSAPVEAASENPPEQPASPASPLEPAGAIEATAGEAQPTVPAPAEASPTLWAAAEVWAQPPRPEMPALLRAGLAQAASLYPPLARLGEAEEPEHLSLDVAEAVEFLEKYAELLNARGFGVLVPTWWKERQRRLKLQLSLGQREGSGLLGMNALVDFDWKIAVGDKALTLDELNELARSKTALVQVRGEWMQFDTGEVQAALKLVQRHQKNHGKLALGEALSLALANPNDYDGLDVESVQVDGWLDDLVAQLSGHTALEKLAQPAGFVGQLRPYQVNGLSWLHFLRQYGFGACLADDMGLGKTIQFLALLIKDLDEARLTRPVLLVCPTTVVNNWVREAGNFAPQLKCYAHHGPARLKGEAFINGIADYHLILTSYALLPRDREFIEKVRWGGVVLDEAHNIKNPVTKQAQIARKLNADYRVALTGTPLENRLQDLWSIMHFLNPGYLGSAESFQRTFAGAIERWQDEATAARLRALTGPFILRRLKTDKTIIQDLPEKNEMREFCGLTKEQAALYRSVTQEALRQIAAADGIRRRGIILATLTKLKQVCNHPRHLLGDKSALRHRSGKLNRLTEMLEQALAEDDRVLIFTQYAEMGELLREHLNEAFGETLYLFGGTPAHKRAEMIEQFQNGGPRLFVLSLKAGGAGINLTRANRVFHFDRWWNPAVENQATDRAFRIGQTQAVQVHKLICRGTLEERIDELITRKLALADQIVGSGENWLTELSTDELRDLLLLRKEAVDD